MGTQSEDLIREAKEIKQAKKITYNDIMEAMKENGVPAVCLSTLRRVFASDSEERASSFNFEETLIPIRDAIKRIDGVTDDSSPAEEVKAMQIVIDLQREELARKETLIKRLIDRLDQKDEIIRQFISDMKQKDSFIQQLTEKCLQ